MIDGQTEADVLQNLIVQLNEEGYEVFLHPKPPILPTFLEQFSPDAIAHRGDKHLVIEIVRSLESNSAVLNSLADAVRANPGWELRLTLLNPSGKQPSLPQQSAESIDSSLHEVQALIQAGHFQAALLVGWATLEALGRKLLPSDLVRPQSPGRVLQFLAQEGWLTPSEADIVRGLVAKRNEYIHGNLQLAVAKNDIERFLQILKQLARARSD